MQAPGASTITLLLLAPLVAWRIYSRVRRMVGRQKLSPLRARITLVVFPLLLMLIGATALTHPERLLLLGAGVACGVALSVYGLRKTRFEVAPDALYYTPNAHLGIALSLLLVARIAWRIVEIYTMPPGAMGDGADFARSPLTLVVFGMLAGYYIGYAVGLLRHRSSVLLAKTERESAAQELARTNSANSESSPEAISATTQNRIPDRDQPTSE
ncbi:MAG: CcdC protein domain-containing protein [Usitatibacter sp.]